MTTVLSYVVQHPGQGTAILNAHRDLCADVTFNRVTGLYAFASHKGARLLVDALAGSGSWARAQKRWVISIDGGITEPEALRHLLRQRRTEVRVPDGQALLQRHLVPIHRFHPKTLLLETANPSAVAGMLVGSANLTGNGLCFGHEHALVARAPAGAALPATLADGVAQVEQVVASAVHVDEAFVDRYEAVRPRNPTLEIEFEHARTELVLHPNAVIPPSKAVALAAADHFWVEVQNMAPNLTTRQTGNQLDLQRGSRVFFGFGDQPLPPKSPIGSVEILWGVHRVKRNLRFGNNLMDKLDLPVPGDAGPPTYANQTLLFTRTGPWTFVLSVGTPAEVAQWKARSIAARTLYVMAGGREFGVF